MIALDSRLHVPEDRKDASIRELDSRFRLMPCPVPLGSGMRLHVMPNRYDHRMVAEWLGTGSGDEMEVLIYCLVLASLPGYRLYIGRTAQLCGRMDDHIRRFLPQYPGFKDILILHSGVMTRSTASVIELYEISRCPHFLENERQPHKQERQAQAVRQQFVVADGLPQRPEAWGPDPYPELHARQLEAMGR